MRLRSKLGSRMRSSMSCRCHAFAKANPVWAQVSPLRLTVAKSPRRNFSDFTWYCAKIEPQSLVDDLRSPCCGPETRFEVAETRSNLDPVAGLFNPPPIGLAAAPGAR